MYYVYNCLSSSKQSQTKPEKSNLNKSNSITYILNNTYKLNNNFPLNPNQKNTDILNKTSEKETFSHAKQVKHRNFNMTNESSIGNIINDNGASFFNTNIVVLEENFHKNDHSHRLSHSNSSPYYYLNDMLSSQFRSATKRTDFIKIENKSNNKFSIHYANGLGHKTEGKSPLLRNFKYSLCGDTCDDVIASESFAAVEGK